MPSSLSPDDLHRLCDEAILLDGHRLAGVVPRDGGPTLVPARHFALPEDVLAEPVPASWIGVALVAGGRAHHLDDATGEPREGAAVRFAYLATRGGRGASVLWTPDAIHHCHDDPGARGHVVDVARRLLGRPTPAEETPPVRLLHLAWIEQLLARAAGGPLGWAEAAALHPAHEGDDGPEALGTALAHHAAPTTWEVLRSGHVRDRLPLGTMGPEQVAALDAGAFARFVLASFPDPDDLCALLAGLAGPDVAARARAAMATAERHLRATLASPAGRHPDSRCR